MLPENMAGDSLEPPFLSPERLSEVQNTCESLRKELAKTIVGQANVVDQLLISLLSGGHSLLVGVPGLAKTLLVRSIADVIGLTFQRIQFTPDLMPADITGTELIEEDRTTGHRQLRFVKGPIFAHIVLADEINRTPPKTQAALLEAMQEKQVTVSGQRHDLPTPFFVLATQNPIEQAGTYPLPEAQLDRFMLEITVDYPTEEDEFEVVVRSQNPAPPQVEQILDAERLKMLRRVVQSVPMAEFDMRYAISLVRATRLSSSTAATELKANMSKYLNWGAGPRASEWLVQAAKAHALISGRDYATSADVRSMAYPVLRHRLVTTYAAEAEGITKDDLIDMLLQAVPGPGANPVHSLYRKLTGG